MSLQEAASLGILPSVSLKDSPIVIDVRNLQIHSAEVITFKCHFIPHVKLTESNNELVVVFPSYGAFMNEHIKGFS